MRKYNLFVIRKEYVSLYRNKEEQLFELLYNLSNIRTNLNYGITLFEQLCKKIEVETIQYYFYQKYHCQNAKRYRFKEGTIFLKPTCIIVESSVNLPSILSIFYRYNKMIFVCDFENKDYFFLDTFLKHKLLQTN